MTCTAGADTDGFNRFDDGRNALHFVAGFENAPLEMVAKCVEFGCDINAFSTNWWFKGPPLAFVETAEVAAELVAHRADVNAADENEVTVLMWAANNGREEAVRYLLATGAEPSAVDRKGRTAVDWAYSQFLGRQVRENVVMPLLEAGIMPGDRDKVPEKARLWGHDRVVACLEVAPAINGSAADS